MRHLSSSKMRLKPQECVSYLLREVRLRMLASVTTGSCKSGVMALWGEGLCAAARKKAWFGSSEAFLLAPTSSLSASKSAGLAGEVEDTADVIQSELIWCWCPWACWNCCVRLCCVCCVSAGGREPRSWCLGEACSPIICSRPPSLCSDILNWRS